MLIKHAYSGILSTGGKCKVLAIRYAILGSRILKDRSFWRKRVLLELREVRTGKGNHFGVSQGLSDHVIAKTLQVVVSRCTNGALSILRQGKDKDCFGFPLISR